MSVVLYGDYSARQADRLRHLLDLGDMIVPVFDDCPAEERAAVFSQATAMVTNKYGAGEPPAPRLKLLQSPSAGMENIDPSRLPPGCAVRSIGGHEVPMAEYALCAMLDWRIGYRALASTVVDGRWTQREWIKGPTHGEVFGTTVGLVGFGRVAQEISRRAAGFGMRRLALSRWSSGVPAASLVDGHFHMEEWARFLPECDFIVVTVPLDDSTRGLVDRGWFAAMKPDAVLINQARGPIVEEAALFEALQERRIGGAVIDVWYNYPVDEIQRVPLGTLPFETLDNLVITPHGSGRTPAMFERRWTEIARNVREALATAGSCRYAG
jgi:phosphoglycerate dehydrogenase-like enzyme